MIGIGVGINRQNFAGFFSNSYSSRVSNDGGVSESLDCVENVSTLLKTASLLLVPSGYKSGKVYSQIPTNGNGDLTWTRGSDSFRTNASGLIQRVPWNLVQQSETFENVYWAKLGTTVPTITVNATTAPNGTTTADLLSGTGGAGQRLQATFTVNLLSAYSVSVYVKANTSTTATINIFDAVTDRSVTLTFSTGAIVVNGSGVTGEAISLGNGWFRLIANYATFATTSINVQFSVSGSTSYFIWGAQLVEGTTAQTYLPTTDRLGFPRLDYTYGSCPALLLEPQRTNLCLYSQTFSDASWITLNSTKVSTNNIDPSNTTTALNVTWASGGSKYFYRTQTGLTIGTTYTITLYVKSSNSSKFRIYAESLAAFSANFTTSSTFQRFQLTYTANSTSQTFGLTSATDNSAADLIVAFAQIEAGAYPTTYISTTTATVTRVADSASKTGISSLIGQTEGTVFLDFIFKASDSNVGGQIGISDSAKANRIILWNNLTFNSLAIQLKANNSNSIAVSLGTFVDGTRYKIAIAYKSVDTAVYVNGTQTITNSASFTFSSSLTDFILGGYETTMASGHQFCFKTALFTSRLLNSDLATLTTL